MVAVLDSVRYLGVDLGQDIVQDLQQLCGLHRVEGDEVQVLAERLPVELLHDELELFAHPAPRSAELTAKANPPPRQTHRVNKENEANLVLVV